MRLPLDRILRDAGLQVSTVPGWETRGRDLDRALGVVGHHTATPPTWSVAQNVATLVNGRPDLAGPLAQLGLDRTGRYWVVASGRANHNGFGTYVPGRAWGNSSVGVEAMNDGLGEPWPAVQLEAYARGAAAILSYLHLPADRFAGHRETDPRRKPDPRGIDLDAMRRRIAAIQAGAPPAQEDLTIMDAPTKTYLDAQFAAVRGFQQLTHDSITGRLAKIMEKLKEDDPDQAAVLAEVRELDAAVAAYFAAARAAAPQD